MRTFVVRAIKWMLVLGALAVVKRFGDGQLVSGQKHGDEIVVNGKHDPHFEVTTTLVRFRVLNESTARLYDVGFTGDRPFSLIGTDGGCWRRRWSWTGSCSRPATGRRSWSPSARATM